MLRVPPSPLVSENSSVSDNVSENSSVPDASSAATSVVSIHLLPASCAEICDNSAAVHQLPQSVNLRPPRTSGLGCRRPAPIVLSARGQKPTQPSLVTSKKTDESEEMAAQSTTSKCEDPSRFVDFK